MSMSNGAASITEDEAALYDRQIRLWGLEAQKKMRNATVLVLRLKGVATEAVKNIVLSGIGSLILVDDEDVAEEDLGAGFFFRQSDIGKKRVDAAKPHVEQLNPLVAIETVAESIIDDPDRIEALFRRVDLICATDWDIDSISVYNDFCRTYNKPFYCGGSYGLLGYVFCDLLDHHYIAPSKTNQTSDVKNVVLKVSYSSLADARQHSWKGLTKRQTKEMNPPIVFSILALWDFQSSHGRLPSSADDGRALETIANQLMLTAAVNRQALESLPSSDFSVVAGSASHEFTPVCAVVGGMLGQDILKALSARDAPIANLFCFDGTSGQGSVCPMSMPVQAQSR